MPNECTYSVLWHAKDYESTFSSTVVDSVIGIVGNIAWIMQYKSYQVIQFMLLYFCKSKMKNFPNVLFYFTLIPMISANIVTLKDIRLMQDVQNDCDFNGKLIRAVVGLSNPSTRVASGYSGDLYGICD